MCRFLRPVVGAVCLVFALCGPLAAAPMTTPEAQPVKPDAEVPVPRAEMAPKPGSRNEDHRSVDSSGMPGPSTGDRNIDLLLDMQGKGAELFKGAETGKPTTGLRPRGAASAPGRPTAEALPADTATEAEQNAEEAALRERRWAGSLAGNGEAASPSNAPSGYRGDLDGVDLRNTPFRKVLIFVRDHREWVIAGAMAVLFSIMALGATSRTRRRH